VGNRLSDHPAWLDQGLLPAHMHPSPFQNRYCGNVTEVDIDIMCGERSFVGDVWTREDLGMNTAGSMGT
jgi:hypothetical protein